MHAIQAALLGLFIFKVPLSIRNSGSARSDSVSWGHLVWFFFFSAVGPYLGLALYPLKASETEQGCSIAWPLFSLLHYIQVICEELTQIHSDPYFGCENSYWPSLCFALLTRASLLLWLVHCLPALLCQTRLISSLLHTHSATHNTLDIHMHTKAAQAPRYVFQRLSVGSSPVAPGLYLSHVCQGRACETTASPVYLLHWRVETGDVGARN